MTNLAYGRASRSTFMPREIEGQRYYSIGEVEDGLTVSRQTLWRWRREGKIPMGKRFRNRQVLFTEAEMQKIREFANRLEPIAPPKSDKQLPLFPNGNEGGNQ